MNVYTHTLNESVQLHSMVCLDKQRADSSGTYAHFQKFSMCVQVSASTCAALRLSVFCH